MTTMARIYASKRGHVEATDWHLPDGERFTIQVRTLRGSTFGSPTVSACLFSGAGLIQIDTYRGKADGLNAWLRTRSLTL